MPENLTPQEPVTPVNEPVDGVAVEPSTPVETPNQNEADVQDDANKVGAPETYTTFDLPEGIEVDQTMLDSFLPVAKELNLTQEQAQGLVNLQTKQLQTAALAQTEAWDKTIDGWTNDSENDQEIGGKDFDSNLAVAKLGIEKFGTKELLEVFDATGVGNHPEIIRVFYRIGKMIKDDNVVFGTTNTPDKTAAEILFPNMS